ncbi:hypothetical protein ABIB94_009207 [Bradyrhizobium sp. JR7.2]|uniref:hypothetical protein n=1 Tax=unclassified Bradyrhizobium TaxID=2631580 RepID=UPI0033988532
MADASVTGQKIQLAGSYRAEPFGASYVGEVDPNERIVITVYLKRRTPDAFHGKPGRHSYSLASKY